MQLVLAAFHLSVAAALQKWLCSVFSSLWMGELTTFLRPISSCSSLLPLKIQSVGFPCLILSLSLFTANKYNVWYNPGLEREGSVQICDKADSLGAIISLITLLQTHSTSRLHGNRLILFPFSAHSAGRPRFTHFSPLYSTDIIYNMKDCLDTWIHVINAVFLMELQYNCRL